MTLFDIFPVAKSTFDVEGQVILLKPLRSVNSKYSRVVQFLLNFAFIQYLLKEEQQFTYHF